MVERTTVIEDQRLTYEGLFDAKEVFKLIDDYFASLYFDYIENLNREVVKPDGKYIEFEITPERFVTDYVRYHVNIRIIMQGVKEVEVKRDGAKVKLNQGKIQMLFNAYYETDYEGTWETGNPWYYVLRTFVNKYLIQPITSQYENELKDITNRLIDELKSFLNLYRY